MIDDLLRRIVDARAVNRLTSALTHIKNTRKLKRGELRTTGSVEDICESARTAIERKLLSVRDLADVVDELEENGAQHIFLFETEKASKCHEIIKNIENKITPRPLEPTPAYYSTLPSKNRTYFERRGEGVVLKLIGKTSFWNINRDESVEEKTRKVTVWNLSEARVVHMLVVDPVNCIVQVRIQHASNQAPPKHWQEELEEFLAKLSGIVPFEDLTPVPIWQGFRNQVNNRDETFMMTDEAHDALTKQRISLRREQGEDIRENEDYNLDERKFARDTLRIYWKIDDGNGSDSRVHTNQQRIQIDGEALGKIWIPRHVSEQVLNDVLGRIQKHTP